MSGEERFVERVRHELDQRAEALPAHISSRLNMARQRALESRSRKPGQQWLPAIAATAMLAVVVSGLWFSLPSGPLAVDVPPAAMLQNAEDFEMLTRSDEFELYADAAFYDWLDKQAVPAG